MQDKTSSTSKEQTTRHPDLEIYIKNSSRDQILNWLKQHCSHLEILSSNNQLNELELQMNENIVYCTLVQKVSGKAWNSLWFKNNDTPWNTDLDCAIVASKELSTQIRCIKTSWAESESEESIEDQWWEVEEGKQTLINW